MAVNAPLSPQSFFEDPLSEAQVHSCLLEANSLLKYLESFIDGIEPNSFLRLQLHEGAQATFAGRNRVWPGGAEPIDGGYRQHNKVVWAKSQCCKGWLFSFLLQPQKLAKYD